MHVATALVGAALIASVWLALQRGDRIFPLIATAAAGIEALTVFGVIALSSTKFRIDVILPAVLVLSAGVTWARSTTKASNTAATVATLVGLLQLLLAIRVLD